MLKSAERIGSLDFAIRDEVPNDFTSFFKNTPAYKKSVLTEKRLKVRFKNTLPTYMFHITAYHCPAPVLLILFLSRRKKKCGIKNYPSLFKTLHDIKLLMASPSLFIPSSIISGDEFV